MIGRLIDLSLRQPLLVFALAALLAAGGVQAWRSLPIDAFPDVSPTRLTMPRSPATRMPRRSSRLRTLPSTRTTRASSPSVMRPAPSLRLLRSSAWRRLSRVTPRAFRRCGSGATS